MVLIKREKKHSRINYDYWEEIQRSQESRKNKEVKEKKISKQIEDLLKE
jgi:hypothetical protein